MSEEDEKPRQYLVGEVMKLESECVVADWFVDVFRRQANGWATRYGGPVYLVGSALTKSRPRDIDVRVMLHTADLMRLFGHKVRDGIGFQDYKKWEWRKAEDELKRSRNAGCYGGIPIDFQIQTVEEFEQQKSLPRVRLDTASDEFFIAGVRFADAKHRQECLASFAKRHRDRKFVPGVLQEAVGRDEVPGEPKPEAVSADNSSGNGGDGQAVQPVRPTGEGDAVPGAGDVGSEGRV